MKKGACFSCLRRNHVSRFCKARVQCLICKKRHLAILCPDINSKVNNSVTETAETKPRDSVLTNQATTSNVLLQTLIVRLKGENREKIIRAIIDTGSEKSYLTEDVIQFLKYKSLSKTNLVHKLFGGVETKKRLHHKYQVNLSSLDENYTCNIHCLDQPVICSDIRKVPNGPWVGELSKYGIKITDLESNPFKVDNEIKLLIGSDVAGSLLTGNVKALNSGPVAVQTHLGWTLMGKIPSHNINEISNSLMVTSLFLKDSSVSDLWKLDVIGISDPVESKTKLEIHKETMQYFKDTLTIDQDGRYEVALPWVVENSRLPSNRKLAEKRLATTQRKLLDSNKTEIYQEVFNTWVSEKIIEIVVEEKESHVHYLPHRPVFKETSETCKVRPVFDASAHVKGSPSLNDCLEKGPNLIEIIPSILNRFRKFSVGLSSDIEKAFLQIGIRSNDRDFLRFLWGNGEEECLKIYRHRRVVFGLNCSPFLLAATLNHHLDKAPENLTTTAQILKESFYVDNCVCSLKGAQEAENFIIESQMLLSSAKFNLRGWQSNFPVQTIVQSKHTEPVPVLGLIWDLEDDTLSCKIDFQKHEQILMTKRLLLSLALSVFDKIGFTSPVTLIPKLILQETWSLNLKWDEELPENLSKRFLKWVNQLHLMSMVKIPRWLNLGCDETEKLSLHIFCDASKQAYATCIYLRVESGNHVSINFVLSRTRVAPLKSITIPRLELLACCIGARLGTTIITDLGMPDIQIYFWSDSSTALSWIHRDVQWGTFVWNRVNEIRSLTKIEQWRYIPGDLNPADLPSRGCSAEQFLLLKWWEGPSWLLESEAAWPKSRELPNEDEINSEKRKTVLTAHNDTHKFNWHYDHFSSYLKTVRMIAWIIWFSNNSRKLNVIKIPDLSCSEFEIAERKLIILIQREAFGDVSDPKIRALRPFVDDYGIMRVKTRVIYRKDTFNFRYPVLLPSDHPVVEQLIKTRHKKLGHMGIQSLIINLREEFWILKCRKTVRKVVSRCVKCQRFSASPGEAPTGPLPEDRVRNAAVFEVVGIDMTGPLFLKGGNKAWIVIFTCAIFRAVHLELATAISTENFLQALRRFISRRGRPSIIYSDNGSNFIGANNLFKSINWEFVSEQGAMEKIRWKFNPPSVPWWGGWWERLIGMLKTILRKVLGNACLNFEEMNTVLCDCESMLNARPLTYVSEDIEDLVPLTPSMFLQEIKEVGVPDLDQLDSTAMNKRYMYRQSIREHLRKRFRSEYLGQLKQNSKYVKNVMDVKVGDVVLVANDNSKRLHWPLAKVIETYAGKDGHIRVVKVQTKSGQQLRPVQRLYSLEMSNEDALGLRKTFPDKLCSPETLEPYSTHGSCDPSDGVPSTTDNNDQKQSMPEEVVTTRSGRKVTKPKRLMYS